MLNNPLNKRDPLGLCPDNNHVQCRDVTRPGPSWTGGGDPGVFLSSDYGMPIFGNDIFDAISGMPGTFLYIDQHGNLSFGFSVNLWSVTQNFLDANPYLRGSSGLRVTIQNFGVDQVTSGLVPEYVALLQERSQILAGMPDRFAQDMGVEFEQLVAGGMDVSAATVQALAFEVKQMQTWFSSEPDAAGWLSMWQGLNQGLVAWANRWGSVFPNVP